MQVCEDIIIIVCEFIDAVLACILYILNICTPNPFQMCMITIRTSPNIRYICKIVYILLGYIY